MPLEPGQISNDLKSLILALNKAKQADESIVIKDFCDKIEAVVFSAIKTATLTIRPGFIIVAGLPTTQSNIAPIVLNNIIT